MLDPAWLEIRIEREGLRWPCLLRSRLGQGHYGSSVFSPLALFDARWPRALRGPAFEPRSVVAHVEWGNYHFVTQHEALWCINCICDASNVWDEWMILYEWMCECICYTLDVWDEWMICMNECANACMNEDGWMNDHIYKKVGVGNVTLMAWVTGSGSSYRICPCGVRVRRSCRG